MAKYTMFTDGTNCEEMERIKEEFEAERNRKIVLHSLKPHVYILSSDLPSKVTLIWTHLQYPEHPSSPVYSRYLVQWQDHPDHPQVVGSLYTSSNTVSLRLLPNTFYIVQVHDLWARKVSSPTIINTSVREEVRVSWQVVSMVGALALASLVVGAILNSMRNCTISGESIPCLTQFTGNHDSPRTLVSNSRTVSIVISDIKNVLGLRRDRKKQESEIRFECLYLQEV